MRSLVALPVLAKNLGQLGAPSFLSCRQLWARGSMASTRLAEFAQIEQIQGTGVVEPSLGWRICK